MADDWKVGDLAVCVSIDPITNRAGTRAPRGLDVGKVYRVRRMGVSKIGTRGLWLVGFPGETCAHGFKVERFRKILPDEPIACETEFRILLDLSKKRVKA